MLSAKINGRKFLPGIKKGAKGAVKAAPMESSMPTYSYLCDKCQKKFDAFHSMHCTEPQLCPTCGHPGRKLLSASSIIFKGSGFYTTDYRDSGYIEAQKRESGESDSGAKKETKSDGGNGKSSASSAGKTDDSSHGKSAVKSSGSSSISTSRSASSANRGEVSAEAA